MASDKAGCVLRCWQIVLIVVGVIFLVLGIMSFVGIGMGGGNLSGVNIALLVIGGLIFLVVGVFAFIVAAKGRQSRPLVICFMITMICFFFMALIMLVLGGLAYASCGDANANPPLRDVICPTSNDRWKYFFALYVILIFTSIIGAAAAFSFWRLLRQEDEGGDKYVYLAEAAY